MDRKDLRCCFMGCNKIPKYHIQNDEHKANYDDCTHSCSEHLEDMVDMYEVVRVWKLDETETTLFK